MNAAENSDFENSNLTVLGVINGIKFPKPMMDA